VVEEQGFEVSIGVVFAGLVVLVSRPARRKFFEPDADVLDEAVLVVVDVDGRRDVHGGDEAEAVGHPAAAHDCLHLGCDVDHFVAFVGVEREVLGVGLHGVDLKWRLWRRGVPLPPLPILFGAKYSVDRAYELNPLNTFIQHGLKTKYSFIDSYGVGGHFILMRR
jgi:hypothetical protein